MSRTRARGEVVWNGGDTGRGMAEGLDGGRLEVRVHLGESAATINAPPMLRRVVDRQAVEGGVRVRLLDHRRAARVELRRVPAMRPVVEVEGAWSAALVEARLRRAAATFKAMQGAADIWPAGYRSCMPTPVRQMFHDVPDGPQRRRPTKEEIDLAVATYEWQLDAVFDKADTTRLALLEAVGHGLKWRKVARMLRARADCQSLSDAGAKGRARRLLLELAELWNGAGHAPDGDDVRLAVSLAAAGRSLIH